jgi:hypothetical protein
MKFFDGKGSARTMEVGEGKAFHLNVANHLGEQLFSLYNRGNGTIQIKLLDGRFLAYDGCADGEGAEFTIGL